MAKCSFFYMVSADKALRCSKDVHDTDDHECLNLDDVSSGPWTDPRKRFKTSDPGTVVVANNKVSENCLAGKHNLIVVAEIYDSPVSEQVVRWCQDCGSVAIDVDFDGRTNPGQIMKMRSPRISKLAQ